MAEEQKTMTVSEKRKSVDAVVKGKIEEMRSKNEIVIPSNYNVGNALNVAWLKIQEVKTSTDKFAVQVCTQTSIANALLNMVIQGLDSGRNQCYFIAYGDQLQMQRSYFGTETALKRIVPEVFKIITDLAHEGDEVEWRWDDFGVRYCHHIKNDPMQNADKPISFGFCNIYDAGGRLLGSTVMTKAEIDQAWRQSRSFKENGVHQKFTSEMAKKTIINRACKHLINTSTDTSSNAVAKAFNETTADSYAKPEEQEKKPAVDLKTQFEIQEGIEDEAIDSLFGGEEA